MQVSLEEMTSIINNSLESNISKIIPNHSISEIYTYPLLPAGKVFRPLLVMATNLDFNGEVSSENHLLFSSFVEMHHTYTLVHDDLPCMDDDDQRRGRASTHIKFNQWKALLSGDGLLIGSFRVLSKINSPLLSSLLKFTTWALGPKGLIQGQVLDLSEEMTESIDKLKRTHELKTGRLIQTSIVGSYLLTNSPNYKTAKELFRFGYHLGLLFQYLDDLTELCDKHLSEHEQKVNPWPKYENEMSQLVLKAFEQVQSILSKHELAHLKEIIKNYYSKIDMLLTQDKENVLKRIDNKTYHQITTQLRSY